MPVGTFMGRVFARSKKKQPMSREETLKAMGMTEDDFAPQRIEPIEPMVPKTFEPKEPIEREVEMKEIEPYRPKVFARKKKLARVKTKEPKGKKVKQKKPPDTLKSAGGWV